jgi:uncharacterized membrane protein YheB (UPF0754 family)
MDLNFIILPLIGAIIGWSTNRLAIKLIFKPVKPVKIPLLNIKFQGLIPKRRNEIASIIGDTIERELLSAEDIIKETSSPQIKREITYLIKSSLLEKIKDKIPGFLPSGLQVLFLNYIKAIIDKEIDSFVRELAKGFSERIKSRIKIGRMVEEKINNYELQELEEIIIKLSNKELKYIEILGGVIGFLIGFGQAILMHYIY